MGLQRASILAISGQMSDKVSDNCLIRGPECLIRYLYGTNQWGLWRMATRTRKKWKPDSNGQYVRQLGWKATKGGKLAQPKFRLGTDLREAKRREMMLADLWEQVEKLDDPAAEEPATWPPMLLTIAQQLARHGAARVPAMEGEPGSFYARRIEQLVRRFPRVPILPADEEAYKEAIEARSQGSAEFLQRYSEAGKLFHRRIRESLEGHVLPGDQAQIVEGSTLHVALREHVDWLKGEYADGDGVLTAWGKTRVKHAEILLDRHDDVPLSRLGHEQLEEMIRYWRQRPPRKGTDRPIAKKSAEHQIAALRFFVRWLSRSTKYEWRKPDSFDEIRARVGSRVDDVRRQVTPEDIFTLDELVLLNRHATPFERLLLLLGINCGFGRAEIASLTVGEVFLRTAHKPRHREIIGFQSTDAESFIKRYRRKTGVYGEHILFPQTVAGIEWALARRRKHAGFGPDARLLVNGKGEPLDKPTAGGNPNIQIPNAFARLIRRVQQTDDGKDFVRRPFKMLRKTAGDLIRRHSDGEVTAVFHCRGQAVRIDDLADAYTNRPFGKVFHAIQEIERYLKPMFDAAGQQPFGE